MSTLSLCADDYINKEVILKLTRTKGVIKAVCFYVEEPTVVSVQYINGSGDQVYDWFKLSDLEMN